MNKILITLIFVSLLTTSYGYDCSIKTFTTLTHLLNTPTKETSWSEQILPNGEKEAPILADVIKVWNEKYPDNQLELVYSVKSVIENGKVKLSVVSGVPYIWVGFPSKEFVTLGGENELHICIAYFYNERVMLVTTVDIKDTQPDPSFVFLVETVTLEEFKSRTALVYKMARIVAPGDLKAIQDLLPN